MASILDEPAIRQAVFPLSVEFYHQAGELGLLGEDVELLEGTLVTKMPKSPLHESLVWLLFELLEGRLPPALCVLKEAPLTFLRSEPEPDLAVVRGTRQDFRRGHPTTAELVIEVAVSTLELDRRKAAIYAGAGVKEYWVVVPAERCVEVYREPQTEGYTQKRTVVAPAIVESVGVPGLNLELGELFGA
ncbi:MAG TPA: Uma2 family endonuclease [Verrucomicrobiota bacterium]|nr:Uma2 family endonuclease [Verrucomicrobiales bacterium]HRI14994.1 Uma2 family endonuclease [Verrucomicrobiota bacterium]